MTGRVEVAESDMLEVFAWSNPSIILMYADHPMGVKVMRDVQE